MQVEGSLHPSHAIQLGVQERPAGRDPPGALVPAARHLEADRVGRLPPMRKAAGWATPCRELEKDGEISSLE